MAQDKTGKTQVQQELDLTELAKPKDEKTKYNLVETAVEGYLDAGCCINVYVGEFFNKAFTVKAHVANGIPNFSRKPTTTPTPTRTYRDTGIIRRPTTKGQVFGRRPRAGRLSIWRHPTGLTKEIGKKTRTVKNFYLRFPSIMDHSACLYFVKEGVATAPLKVKIDTTWYQPDQWEKIELAKMGNKYSSKMSK